MISDYSDEQKVIKYAKNNSYTLIANTGGALEYIKITNEEKRVYLKWAKGTHHIVLTEDSNSKKIDIIDLERENK